MRARREREQQHRAEEARRDLEKQQEVAAMKQSLEAARAAGEADHGHLAAKLQSLKDASGAEALHDAVEAPRGTAAAAAANGPPALKPGLKPLRYEDCLDGNIEKQIRGSTLASCLVSWLWLSLRGQEFL